MTHTYNKLSSSICALYLRKCDLQIIFLSICQSYVFITMQMMWIMREFIFLGEIFLWKTKCTYKGASRVSAESLLTINKQKPLYAHTHTHNRLLHKAGSTLLNSSISKASSKQTIASYPSECKQKMPPVCVCIEDQLLSFRSDWRRVVLTQGPLRAFVSVRLLTLSTDPV